MSPRDRALRGVDGKRDLLGWEEDLAALQSNAGEAERGANDLLVVPDDDMATSGLDGILDVGDIRIRQQQRRGGLSTLLERSGINVAAIPDVEEYVRTRMSDEDRQRLHALEVKRDVSAGPYAWTPSSKEHEYARADGLPRPFKVKAALGGKDPKAASIRGSLASASTSLVVRAGPGESGASLEPIQPEEISEADHIIGALLHRVQVEYRERAEELVASAAGSQAQASNPLAALHLGAGVSSRLMDGTDKKRQIV